MQVYEENTHNLPDPIPDITMSDFPTWYNINTSTRTAPDITTGSQSSLKTSDGYTSFERPSIQVLQSGYTAIAYEERDSEGKSKISVSLRESMPDSLSDKHVFYYRELAYGTLFNSDDLSESRIATFRFYDPVDCSTDSILYLLFRSGPLKDLVFTLNPSNRQTTLDVDGAFVHHTWEFNVDTDFVTHLIDGSTYGITTHEITFDNDDDANDIEWVILSDTSKGFSSFSFTHTDSSGERVPVACPSIVSPSNNLTLGGEDTLYIAYQAFVDGDWNTYLRHVILAGGYRVLPAYKNPYSLCSDEYSCNQYYVFDNELNGCNPAYNMSNQTFYYTPTDVRVLEVDGSPVTRINYNIIANAPPAEGGVITWLDERTGGDVDLSELPLDLMVVLDVSASMSDNISTVASRLEAMANSLLAENVLARFGVTLMGSNNPPNTSSENGTHCGGDYLIDAVSDVGVYGGFTESPSLVSSAAQSQPTTGASTPIFSAIKFSLEWPTIQWRPYAKKLILVITDQETCQEGSSQCPDFPDSYDCAERVCDLNGVIVSLAYPTGATSMDCYRDLATHTGWTQTPFPTNGPYDIDADDLFQAADGVNNWCGVQETDASCPAFVVERSEDGWTPTFLKKASLVVTFAGDISRIWTNENYKLAFYDNPPNATGPLKGLSNFPLPTHTGRVFGTEPVHLEGDTSNWVIPGCTGSPSNYELAYDYPNVGIPEYQISSPILIAEEAIDPCLSVNKNGKIYVIYETKSSDRVDILIKGDGDFHESSLSGPIGGRATRLITGDDFAYSQTLSGSAGSLNQLADVVVDKSNVTHVVWQSNENGVWNVCYANSSTSFEVKKITSLNSRSMKPKIEAHDDGTIFVVFHDDRFKKYQIMAAKRDYDRTPPWLQQNTYLTGDQEGYRHYHNGLPLRFFERDEYTEWHIDCDPYTDSSNEYQDEYYEGEPNVIKLQFTIPALSTATSCTSHPDLSGSWELTLHRDTNYDLGYRWYMWAANYAVPTGGTTLDSIDATLDINLNRGVIQLDVGIYKTDMHPMHISREEPFYSINEDRLYQTIFKDENLTISGFQAVCESCCVFVTEAVFPVSICPVFDDQPEIDMGTSSFEDLSFDSGIEPDTEVETESYAMVAAGEVSAQATYYTNPFNYANTIYIYANINIDGTDPDIPGAVSETEAQEHNGIWTFEVPYVATVYYSAYGCYFGGYEIDYDYANFPGHGKYDLVHIICGLFENGMLWIDIELVKDYNSQVHRLTLQTDIGSGSVVTPTEGSGYNVLYGGILSHNQGTFMARGNGSYAYLDSQPTPILISGSDLHYGDLPCGIRTGLTESTPTCELIPVRHSYAWDAEDSNGLTYDYIWAAGTSLGTNALFRFNPITHDLETTIISMDGPGGIWDATYTVPANICGLVGGDGMYWVFYPDPADNTSTEIGLLFTDGTDFLYYEISEHWFIGPFFPALPDAGQEPGFPAGDVVVLDAAYGIDEIDNEWYWFLARRTLNGITKKMIFIFSFRIDPYLDRSYIASHIFDESIYDNNAWTGGIAIMEDGTVCTRTVSGGNVYYHIYSYSVNTSLNSINFELINYFESLSQEAGLLTGVGDYKVLSVNASNRLIEIDQETGAAESPLSEDTEAIDEITALTFGYVGGLGPFYFRVRFYDNLSMVGDPVASVNSITHKDMFTVKTGISAVIPRTEGWLLDSTPPSILIFDPNGFKGSDECLITLGLEENVVYFVELAVIPLDDDRVFIQEQNTTYSFRGCSDPADGENIDDRAIWRSSGLGRYDLAITDKPYDCLSPEIVLSGEILAIMYINNDSGGVEGVFVDRSREDEIFGTGSLSWVDYSIASNARRFAVASDIFRQAIVVSESFHSTTWADDTLPVSDLKLLPVLIDPQEVSASTASEACSSFEVLCTSAPDLNRFIKSDLISKVILKQGYYDYLTYTVSGVITPVVSDTQIFMLIYGVPEILAVRFRNENSTSYSDWYAWLPEAGNDFATLPWTISSGPGLKKVGIQAVTYGGLIDEFYIPIVLDCFPPFYRVTIKDREDDGSDGEEVPTYQGYYVTSLKYVDYVASLGEFESTASFNVEIETTATGIGDSVRFDILQQGVTDTVGLTANYDSQKQAYLGTFDVHKSDGYFYEDGLARIRVYLPGKCELSPTPVEENYSTDEFNQFEDPTTTGTTSIEVLEDYLQPISGKVGLPIRIRPETDPYFIFGEPDRHIDDD